MDRVYYSINENTARQAKEMMSYDSYNEGSKTKEYQRMCDETYEIAEEDIKARPDEEDKIVSLAHRYAKKLADNMNKDSEIGCRCPSVLISGAGNFPTKKKEKQVAAWEKNHEEFESIQKIQGKIRSIANGKDIIKSDDENVIEKLERKLAELEKLQATMKEANKAIRMKDTDKGDEKLRGMGYTDAMIVELRKPDFCGRAGYPNYALSNNNSRIRATRARLETIRKAKEGGTEEIECEFFRIEENVEDMRIRLFFDKKPELEVRQIVKSHGFRWAPSVGAWQRNLNSNGRYAVRKVIEELKEAEV